MIIVLHLFGGRRVAISTSDIERVTSAHGEGCDVKLKQCNEPIQALNSFDDVIQFWSME